MKPASRPQYYRIKRIVDMLREGSEEGYLPNRGDFRRELEVSPRTLARDLDFLRDEERAPIEYDPQAHGYRLTFERPEGFDARTRAKEAFGITGGDKAMKVRLLFEPKLAVYVSERQWHPSQVLKKRRDGRVELRIGTTGHKELVRWVLSWMPDVRVLAPKSLRDRIALKLEEGVRRNRENRENRNEDMPNQTLHANREQARGWRASRPGGISDLTHSSLQDIRCPATPSRSMPHIRRERFRP